MEYIDNLKVFLTILVIAVHTAVTYGSEGGWYYEEATQDMLAIVPLTMLSAICQSFFMSLFFFISAFFTPESYDRKGFKKFMIDKGIRLGIPCIAFFFLLAPLTDYLVLGLIEGKSFNYQNTPHIGPLWFVQALLIFSITYALYRLLRRNKERNYSSGLPGTLQIIILAVLMSVLTFVARYYYPMGTGIFGMQLGSFPQYIMMFLLGIAANRKNWLSEMDSVSTKPFSIAVGIMVLLLPVLMVVGEDPVHGLDLFMGSLSWQGVVYAVWESLMCIAMSVVLVRFFKKRYNKHNRVTKTMARSAYTSYIIHPVILVATSYAMINITIHPLIKFSIVLALASAVTFTLASRIKQLPVLNKIL